MDYSKAIITLTFSVKINLGRVIFLTSLKLGMPTGHSCLSVNQINLRLLSPYKNYWLHESKVEDNVPLALAIEKYIQ